MSLARDLKQTEFRAARSCELCYLSDGMGLMGCGGMQQDDTRASTLVAQSKCRTQRLHLLGSW